MKQVGKFKLLELREFEEWLHHFERKRQINMIQQHHTYIPAYKHFNGNNHFHLCESMEREHIKRGFDQIGQNITTFNDGTIMICRDLNIKPAGIKFQNSGAICIEHAGNFDKGKDILNETHRLTVIQVTKLLLEKFNIVPNKNNLVYHHWFDLNTGERIEEEGKGIKKSCPGSAFFGGNTIEDYNKYFLTLFI